jgi:4-hydroxy-2-oxoheptanedioate aldolase
MPELPRLNKVIEALAAGKPAFTSFCQADPETAIAMATAKYDGIVFEMEHNPWDIRALRDSLQYMLNRGQIARSGSVAPAVPGQTGARPRRLRHRLAAHQHGRRGL